MLWKCLYSSLSVIWKGCASPPPHVLSDFLFKAPHATTGNTASLNWNLGRVSGVSVHCYVQHSTWKQKERTRSDKFCNMKKRNVRMWLKHRSITHTYIGYVSLWLSPNQSALPASKSSCRKINTEYGHFFLLQEQKVIQFDTFCLTFEI